MLAYENAMRTAVAARPKRQARDVLGMTASWLVVVAALVACVAAQVLGVAPAESGDLPAAGELIPAGLESGATFDLIRFSAR